MSPAWPAGGSGGGQATTAHMPTHCRCLHTPHAQGPCIAGAGGNRSSVVITVQDACPGCPAGELALHPLAFARLANLSRNAIPVRYRQARTVQRQSPA